MSKAIVGWIVILMFGIGVAGCADLADLNSRYVWGRDCRQDHLQPDGQCSKVK